MLSAIDFIAKIYNRVQHNSNIKRTAHPHQKNVKSFFLSRRVKGKVDPDAVTQTGGKIGRNKSEL